MQCLEVWRGLNPGPYIHSLHFSYSVGALVASILAKPFLGAPARVLQGNSTTSVVASLTATTASAAATNMDDDNDILVPAISSTIGTLYPITAIVTFAVSDGYLFLGSKEIMNKMCVRTSMRNDQEDDETETKAFFFGNDASSS